MPNKKIMDHEEYVSERPRRKTRAKESAAERLRRKTVTTRENEYVSERLRRKTKSQVVFDSSIPEKKKKYSHTHEKPTAVKKVKTKGKSIIKKNLKTIVKKNLKKKSKTVRRTIRRKKPHIKKSKSVSVNPVSEVTELLSRLSAENDTTSHVNSPLIPETPETCNLCSTDTKMTELVDCPICFIKVHKHCLVVNEPVWIYKLNLCPPWLCRECRKQNCVKCLKDESQSEITFRCVSCEVGLHTNCYTSCGTEEMHKIQDNLYVCVPCADLASKIHPIEKDDDNIEHDLEPQPCTSGTMYASSIEDESDSKSDSSYENMLNDETRYPSNSIPNITNWTKYQVLDYLAGILDQKIIDKIARHDLDGKAILLMNRSNIVSTKMGLKLGEAMKFYKQVRILQTQSTHERVFWE